MTYIKTIKHFSYPFYELQERGQTPLVFPFQTYWVLLSTVPWSWSYPGPYSTFISITSLKPSFRSLAHSFGHDREEASSEDEALKVMATGERRLAGPGPEPACCGWHYWILVVCIYFVSSHHSRSGKRGKRSDRRVWRVIYKCEAKAEPEGRKTPLTEEPPPEAPSARSSSSPSREGCGVPKWVPSGSAKWLPSSLGAAGCW